MLDIEALADSLRKIAVHCEETALANKASGKVRRVICLELLFDPRALSVLDKPAGGLLFDALRSHDLHEGRKIMPLGLSSGLINRQPIFVFSGHQCHRLRGAITHRPQKPVRFFTDQPFVFKGNNLRHSRTHTIQVSERRGAESGNQ